MKAIYTELEQEAPTAGARGYRQRALVRALDLPLHRAAVGLRVPLPRGARRRCPRRRRRTPRFEIEHDRLFGHIRPTDYLDREAASDGTSAAPLSVAEPAAGQGIPAAIERRRVWIDRTTGG